MSQLAHRALKHCGRNLSASVLGVLVLAETSEVAEIFINVALSIAKLDDGEFCFKISRGFAPFV